MRRFWALLGLSLKAMLYSFRVGGGKKRAFTGAGALLLMGGLALYLSGTYSFLFAAQLRRVDMLPLLIMMMPVLMVLAGFFFTVFAAQGVLFGGKDNDLMLSLPVSSFTLLLSRLSALYLENLFFGVFVMLPAGAAYLFFGGGGDVRFFLTLLLGTVLMAFLPTLLALVAGFLLGWVSARFARKSLVSVLLYGVMLVGVVWFSFRASFLLQDLTAQAMGVESALRSWGTPFVLLSEAACDGNLLSLVILAALCLGPFLVVSAVVARFYVPLITGLQSRGGKGNYRLGALRASGSTAALLKKEAVRFFTSPIYLFNAGLGLILLLVGAVAALVKRAALLELIGQISGLGELPILPLLAAMLGFLLSTVTLTACSVSLEGKEIWILKEAPLSPRGLLMGKVGFALLLTLPCVVVGSVCAALAFGLTAGEGLLLTLLGAVFALFSAPFGLLLNLCFPKLDASNDTLAVKQSASVVITLFGSMLVVALMAGVYLLSGGLGWCLPALLLCAGLAWAALLGKGPGLFLAL